MDLAQNWLKGHPRYHFLTGKYWVSVSLHYPYEKPVYEDPALNEAVSVLDALLVPGGGHVHDGNPRGIAYLVATAGFMHKYLSTDDKTYRNIATGIYIFSLIDFLLCKKGIW